MDGLGVSPQVVINATFLLFYTMAFVVSLWVGNFLTSFYFRIPRGITLNGKKMPPMCSNCKTRLKYPDYGPLYYYLIKSKVCKVCGVKISSMYFFIELSTALLLIANFYLNGINEGTVISAFFIAAIILTLLINLEHNQCYQLSNTMLLFCALVRGVYLSTHGEFLYDITFSAFVGLFFSILLGKRLPQNYRFFFIAICCGFGVVENAMILSFVLAIYFANKMLKIVEEKYTNAVFLACVFCLINLVFFQNNIEPQFLYKKFI